MNKKYINIDKPEASILIGKAIDEMIEKEIKEIVFICIGSDKVIGDALGPLVGNLLEDIDNEDIHIYGALDAPVHAKNLQMIINTVDEEHEEALVIAIDASLGAKDKVGNVVVNDSPLCPGQSFSKDLPLVGDISIKGVVNSISKEALYLSKQSKTRTDKSSVAPMSSMSSTRLYVVYKMATVISQGIKNTPAIADFIAWDEAL